MRGTDRFATGAAAFGAACPSTRADMSEASATAPALAVKSRVRILNS
jgi:hypothetical protein